MHLVLISTNEVFDGTRTDGRGYAPDDVRHPINAYGESKLEAEDARLDAMAASAGGTPFAIVRTSWLHGPPGNDFPAKIARAALRAKAAGEPLRVVGDEIGTPDLHAGRRRRHRRAHLGGRPVRRGGPWRRSTTSSTAAAPPGPTGRARSSGRPSIDVEIEEVPASTWQRASTPPLWAVLEPTPLPSGEPMRDWRLAFADAVPALKRELRSAR